MRAKVQAVDKFLLLNEQQKCISEGDSNFIKPNSKPSGFSCDFFKEEIQLQKPFEIPITNPKHFKNLNTDADEKLDDGQKSKRELTLEHLQNCYDKISQRTADQILKESLLQKTLVDQISNVHLLSKQRQNNMPGYVKIRQSECEASYWLDQIDLMDIEPNEIMTEYKDTVMLKQVFGLGENEKNILETERSTKCLLNQNPENLGERFRNMNIIKRDDHYFMIIDDTTEKKYESGLQSLWTASLLIYSFDPKEKILQPVWKEELAQSDQMIFINSVIQGQNVYFVTKSYSKHRFGTNGEDIEIYLKKLNLDQLNKGSEAVKTIQIYILKRKVNEITSLILSSLFQEGKDIQQKFDNLFSKEENVFVDQVYLAVSTSSRQNQNFETSIFKMNANDTKFKSEQRQIPLNQFISIPGIFLLNTSKFNLFVKDHSYECNEETESYNFEQIDGFEWQINQNFLAMSGWNHNMRDKNTVYKYIQILDYLDGKKQHQIELEEIKLTKVEFSTYMTAIGNVTNPLVRYFKDRESELNKAEVLLHQYPKLNTFNIDLECLEVSYKMSQPQELNSTCEALRRLYMNGVKGLNNSEKQYFQTQFIFDNIQSKFFLVLNHWHGEKDQMFFVEIIQLQNNLEPISFSNSEFNSALDRNLINILFSYQSISGEGNQYYTISKKMQNVFRCQSQFYIAFKIKDVEAIKPIQDPQHEFEVLNSPSLNIFRKHFHMLNSNSKVIFNENCKKLKSSVIFFENENFFMDLKSQRSFCLKLNCRRKSLQDENQFTQLMFQEIDPQEVQSKSNIEIICPRVRYVEDDRWTMPFVAMQTDKDQAHCQVKDVWFVMLNLQTFTVERTININLTCLELNEIRKTVVNGSQVYNQIQICQSKSCKRMGQIFEEKMQVAVILPKSIRIMIFEFDVHWKEQESVEKSMSSFRKSLSRMSQTSQISSASSGFQPGQTLHKLQLVFQSGQKELIGSKNRKFDNCKLMPVFDRYTQINETQILLNDKEEFFRIRLQPGFQDFNYHTSNAMLRFGYKIFRAKFSQKFDILQVDVFHDINTRSQFKESEITDFACSQLLSIQIRTLFNMIPFDFVDYQTKNCSQQRVRMFFKPMQLLEGHSKADLIYKKPHKVKCAFDAFSNLKNVSIEQKRLLEITGYKVLSLIERVIGNDIPRALHLVNIGLLSTNREVNYDFQQSNCLQRCFKGDNSVQLMNSADMLIEHMLTSRQTQTGTIRNMLVGILPFVASNIDQRKSTSKQYIKFFIDQVEPPEMAQFTKENYMNLKYNTKLSQKFERILVDQNNELPKYMDKSLHLEALSLNAKQFGLNDLTYMVRGYIQNLDDPESSMYEVEHSYIDLRQVYLNRIRQRIYECAEAKGDRGRLQRDQLGCDQYLISDCVLALVEEYFDEIDNCSVLKKIITHQYNRQTFYYYISLFYIYLFGFICPFINLIYQAIKLDPEQDGNENPQNLREYMKLNVCLFTQTVIVYLEYVEMKQQGKRIYFQQIWNWVDIINAFLFLVFYLMRKNWFPGVENDDSKFLPISYMGLLDDDGKIELTHNDINSVAVMQLMTVLLLGSMIMKTFSLLKVLPSVGAFTAVTYSILGSTAQFLCFLLSWIVLFTILYMVVGIRIDDSIDGPKNNFYNSHNRFEILQGYLLLTIKNSITGPEDPTDNFWTRLSEESTEDSRMTVRLMNSMIILIWIIGVVLLLVFLLNLQISILSGAYSEYSDLKEMYTFKQQALMNKECNLVLGSFPLQFVFDTSRDVDCIIISSVPKSQETGKYREVKEETIEMVEEIVNQQNQKFDQLQEQIVDLNSKFDMILQRSLPTSNEQTEFSPKTPKLYNTLSNDESNLQSLQLRHLQYPQSRNFSILTDQTPMSIRKTIRKSEKAKYLEDLDKKEMKENQIRILKAKENRQKQLEIEVDQEFDKENRNPSLGRVALISKV